VKGEHALVASLLGPSEVKTQLGGETVVIKEQTNYPFENIIQFEVTAADVEFELKIRKPDWLISSP
jgi:DUF1680 family protein